MKIPFSFLSRTIHVAFFSLDDDYLEDETNISENAEEKGKTDGNCRIAEEINTFTIHLAIFTSDNLLAKLRKLVDTLPLLGLLGTVLYFILFFFRFMHPKGCVEFQINVCAISRGDFAEIHKLTIDYL